VATQRLAELAAAMGAAVSGAPAADNAQRCIAAIRRLSAEVGIPAGLRELGVKPADIPTLAANALVDACGLTNPRRADQADLEGIFRAAL
jgi:alcohol dehydrogenase